MMMAHIFGESIYIKLGMVLFSYINIWMVREKMITRIMFLKTLMKLKSGWKSNFHIAPI